MPAKLFTPSRNTWKLGDRFRPMSIWGVIFRAHSHFTLPAVG